MRRVRKCNPGGGSGVTRTRLIWHRIMEFLSEDVALLFKTFKVSRNPPRLTVIYGI